MRIASVIAVTLFAVALLAVSVDARFYQYRDSDGNMRYTDDLGLIPEHLRQSAQSINATAPPSSPEMPETAGEQRETNNSNGLSDDGGDAVAQEEALRRERSALLEEYENIREAIAEAGSPPGPDASDDAVSSYNRTIEAINGRIENYNKKMEDHEKRVQEYNARFDQ